jgi:indole-3-glycerol phosphate synthase
VSDALARILADKRDEIAMAKARLPQDAIELAAAAAPPVRGFAAALGRAMAARRVGLIAEIKKASPSVGLIRADFDPPALARAYAKGGAACLSVLTDRRHFQGEAAHLAAARAACDLPVLRKDFMLDPYQLAEARAMGADCVLLILAALDDETARGLEEGAQRWGMDVLAEVHDAAELTRALRLKTRLIGINNRDLKTLKTDIATAERLAPLVPRDRIAVAESGLATPEHIDRLRRAGISCFLIGESLMRQSDVEAATRRLVA